MLIEIYILLIILGITFMILSFFRKDITVFAFLSFLFFISTGISSFNVEKSYCETNSTVSFMCHKESHNTNPLSFLWMGLGLAMLVYAIIMAFWKGGEELQEALDRT